MVFIRDFRVIIHSPGAMGRAPLPVDWALLDNRVKEMKILPDSCRATKGKKYQEKIGKKRAHRRPVSPMRWLQEYGARVRTGARCEKMVCAPPPTHCSTTTWVTENCGLSGGGGWTRGQAQAEGREKNALWKSC